MKWAEMSEQERDELIHEKVMGHPLTCNEMVMSREVGLEKKFYLLSCRKCGSLGSSDQPPETNVHRNNEEALPYTTNMDAAWHVAEKFPRMELARKAATGSSREIIEVWMLTDVDRWENGMRQPSKRHYGVANTAPEAICLAALEACGVKFD